MNSINRVWVLNRHADGPMADDNLALRGQPVPEPADGQIRVRSVYLSLDPTNRVWLSPHYTYLPPIPLGDPMRGFIIGVVEKTLAAGWEAGDVVYGLMYWADYCVVDPRQVSFMTRMPRTPGLSLEAWICALSMNGHTAYYGLFNQGRLRAGETVLISGAAGATGSLAGQIARIAGARVVGIAGGPEKCRSLLDDYGFDAAIDYKQGNLMADIAAACPHGVDVFFDNVGGPTLDAALMNLAMGARVVVCGAIADYDHMHDATAIYGVKGTVMLLLRRARMEGFVVFDFLGGPEQEKAERSLVQWYLDGKLRYKAHVIDGLENAFPSLSLLFTGGNKGKLIVRISSDPA